MPTGFLAKTALLYGLVCCGVLLSWFLVVPRLFPLIFRESFWTVWKEILHILACVLAVACGNILFSHFYFHEAFSRSLVWQFLWWTIAVSILPVILMVLLRQVQLMKTFSRQAAELDRHLAARSTPASPTIIANPPSFGSTSPSSPSDSSRTNIPGPPAPDNNPAANIPASLSNSPGSSTGISTPLYPDPTSPSSLSDSSRTDISGPPAPADNPATNIPAPLSTAHNSPDITPSRNTPPPISTTNPSTSGEMNLPDGLAGQPEKFLYAEAADNYVKIFYTGDQQLIRSTLKQLEDVFSSNSRIFRCHRTYLVNLDKVIHISGNAQGYKLHLEGASQPIPVSRTLNGQIANLVIRPNDFPAR